MSIPGAASPLFIGAAAGAAAAYQIDRSIRINDDDTAHLNRTFSSGSRKVWTWSGWVKRSKLSAEANFFSVGASSTDAAFRFNDDDTLKIRDGAGSELVTNAVFRDPSAWYHIVISADSTQGTASNRLRLYVNGVEQTYSSSSYASQSADGHFNNNVAHYIGRQVHNTSNLFDGYLAEVHWVDGQQLAPTDFGEYNSNNVWQPIEFAGSYTQTFGGRTIANSNGALPILNTSGDDGGTATSGVRSDSSSSYIVLALPLNGSNNGTTITDYHHTIKGSGSAKTVSIFTGDASGGAVTSTAQSKYYGSSFYAVRGATNDYDDSDYLYLTGDTDLDFGTGDFCVEFWYRPGTFVQNSVIFDNRHPSTGWPNSSAGFQFFTNHLGELFFRTGSGGPSISSSGVLSVGTWSHLAITRSSGTVNVYHNGTSVGSTSTSNNFNEGRFVLGSAANNGEGSNGYYADLRIYKGTSKYTGNFNVPIVGTGGVNSFYLKFADNSSNAALGTDSSGLSNTWTVNNLIAAGQPNYSTDGSTSGSFYTSAGGAASKMFDGSASTGAFSQTGTATFTFGTSITVNTSLQVRAFKGDASGANVLINGTDISSLLNAQSGGGYSTVNVTSTLGGAPLTLSNVSVVNASGGSGNIAQIFVDGTELVDGTGVSSTDSLIDTPTNYTADSGNNGGNYATLSAVDNSGVTLSNGNLEVATSGWQSFKATIGVSSGKYYWESQNKQSAGAILGVATAQASVWPNGSIFGSTGHGGGDSNPAWTWAGANYYFNATTAGTGLSNHSATDIVMYALDLDNGKMWFGRNGTWYSSSWATNGNPATGANATVSGLDTSYTYLPAGTAHSGGAIYNFGQRPFAHTPPTGFKSLCTTNLADPTIADGSTAFDAKLYTGNGSNTNTISGLSFSPDLAWLKRRNDAGHHALYDAVRGAYKHMGTSHQLVEKTEPTGRGLSAFNSDGFTIDTSNGDHTGSGNINVNSSSYVAWAWDAGTSTASNTDGSITSSVRANQTAGFSIVSYQGNGSTSSPSVGHGLNASLGLVIIKNRDGSQTYPDWYVKHKDIGDNYNTRLNLTAGRELATGSGSWYQGGIGNLTSSSVITFVTGSQSSTGNVNSNGINYIAYCFAPVEGFSAFGSYTGNGSADGPFIFTGMRPKWLLIKRTDSSKAWQLMDTSRDPINPADTSLFPAGSDAESGNNANYYIDILSNGFKIRTNHDSRNTSSGTYIYAAFAEHPFKTARAR